MTDHLSKNARRKNMQKITAKSRLEALVSKELWRRGWRFRKNVNNLIGKPDIAIKKYKAVIFIDSCFWHNCPEHGNIPKTNREYWLKKLNNNKKRDAEVTSWYLENGWNIKRIWEHDIKNNFNDTIDDIEDFLNASK
ncbi:very short patch repair endonuclease [Salisediminibacterium halotolerans]|uniref:Very short patch repair endonuclease n=1 Tax=Salisediminibacterium halotolerans TaxID=517425 RepID=A0A1H9RE80_9BACI|nr:very short patch repair endonuclease [Salisediminibacterium haloalkalitolerans]SER70855.1 DNA mismatch endonuclease, patch repair protein [Salisediminibacterium haloalkalitolerans]